MTDAPIELIQIKEEFFDSEDTEHISTSNTQDQSASTSKKNDDKSSHSKEKPSSLKKTDNDKEKPKDPKSGSKLGRHSISDREIKRRDSEAVRPEERSSRDDRSKRNDRSQVLERSRARTTRRSPPYRHRSRSRDRRSPFNRGGNTRNTKKPSFLEEITSKYPDLMDQSQNVGRHNHNSYIPPQPQMMAFQHPNDMFQGYQPMPNMYPQTQVSHFNS